MKRKLLAGLVLLLMGACESSDKQGSFDQAIGTLAEKLERTYVFPDVGAQYAARLRDNVAKGVYLDMADSQAISEKLTADLQAVSPDKHLRVVPLGKDGPRPPPSPGADAGSGAPSPPIGDAKWIADGIAYIDFNSFPGTPETLATVDTFMKEHASAKAIIVDGRTHRGGGRGEMNVMFPYLFAEERRLVYMDIPEHVIAKRGVPFGDEASLRVVPGPPGMYRREHVVIPHPTEHRLFKVRVFYLTSTTTGSAGEHLALAFKHTGRATLVGEQTAGANHFGGFEPLDDRLTAFVPYGRTVDPSTEQDWEGVGIAPDVRVPAERALDEALKLLR